MVLSYAPFDDPVAPRPPSYIPEHVQRALAPRPIERDATECNYLIMFFVAGVFLLGLADAMR
ncbi:hypothetical protein [Yellowstone lake phycodnavirus 3]|jgi:hypothetical protein|uniref:hypothetical protein n=1 Tax=Yellowstone lake phycodnavirus 3 TaxID=1586715 RepID=UPI0006EB70F9|nr:hypothetical protein AR677_gp179 [Yellowstone lake phycodnavirus 3]BAT22678.1 hypothetical protein [Yellowstone lake phycodnavirus 3]